MALDAVTKRHIDENGFLHVDLTPISKATVNPYYGKEIPDFGKLGLDPNKIYYGLRPADELKKAAETFNGLPLLYLHHLESAEAPQKESRIGSTGTDTTFKKPYLLSTLSITDADAIRQIENGTCKELSCAYRYEPKLESGTFDGKRYDFIMRNIRGNHVALVPEGRAGSDVAVADALPKQMKRSEIKLPNTKKLIYAFDATPKIYEAKVALDELMGACGGMEEQGADIDAVITKFMPNIDEAGREVIKQFLANFQKAPGDTAPGATVPPVATTPVKEPMAKPTGDAEADEPKPKEKEDKKPAMDAKVVADIRAQATQEAMEKMRSLNTALKECKNIIGTDVDALSFDSAEDIYKKALEVKGIDPKLYPADAYKGMVDILNSQKPIATDNKTIEDKQDYFKNVKINVQD